jgi:hypothetical protein
MKSLRTKFSNSKYPADYKDVYNHYLLRNEFIEKYNKDESNILKDKKHD